jgi:hypothetical protein
MHKFSEFLEEQSGKNLHLEHLEDEVFNGGYGRTHDALKYLEALRDMLGGHSQSRLNITTKWDGAPAIFAGINPENGKFFVGTKGVFARNPKINYTPQDIDTNHPNQGLNVKLKAALQYLPEIGITGVLQGDMMFIRSDLESQSIDGDDYTTFQPNTIVYAVPSGSTLDRQIRNSKVGVVWHTTYNGRKLSDMRASFGADVGHLRSSRNVWYRDASFNDTSGTATFTSGETKKLTTYIESAENVARTIPRNIFNHIERNDNISIHIKAWNNKKVRAGEKIGNARIHVKGLIDHTYEKLTKHVEEAKNPDTIKKRTMERDIVVRFYKKHTSDLIKMYELHDIMTDAKNMVVSKLQQVKDIGTFVKTDTGFRVTSPEGFVAIDRMKGNAVKLVDRLEFSHNNFTAIKSW